MKHSEHIESLSAALVKAQKGLGLPKKNREVKVKSDKGSYTFEYTTFDAIIEHVRDKLTENGLWFVQTTEAGEQANILITTLVHESGQWIESSIRIPPASTMQGLGSTLTYLKRYALSSMLGIAAEEDDDANAADGNHIEEKADRGPYSVQSKPAQVNGNHNLAARKWHDDSIKAIRAFETPTDLNAWEERNRGALRKLANADTDLHRSMMEALADAYERIEKVAAE